MAQWGKTDSAADAPKYLESAAANTNKSHDADNAIFVDLTEAGIASNNAKGIKTPGWNLYHTYQTADGRTRHIVEPLVPMKVSAVDAGDRADGVANTA